MSDIINKLTLFGHVLQNYEPKLENDTSVTTPVAKAISSVLNNKNIYYYIHYHDTANPAHIFITDTSFVDSYQIRFDNTMHDVLEIPYGIMADLDDCSTTSNVIKAALLIKLKVSICKWLSWSLLDNGEQTSAQQDLLYYALSLTILEAYLDKVYGDDIEIGCLSGHDITKHSSDTYIVDTILNAFNCGSIDYDKMVDYYMSSSRVADMYENTPEILNIHGGAKDE